MKKKEFLTRVCQFVFSLLSLLSVLVFGLFEFFFILPKKHRKIHIFQHTHTREKKRKEKKRRETTFLIRLFTRTSSYTHRRHLKHIKERERDYLVCRLSTTHTLSTLFLSLSLSLSLLRVYRILGSKADLVLKNLVNNRKTKT